MRSSLVAPLASLLLVLVVAGCSDEAFSPVSGSSGQSGAAGVAGGAGGEAGQAGAGGAGAGGAGAGGASAGGQGPTPWAGLGLVAIPPGYDTSAKGWGQVTQAAQESGVSFVSTGYLGWRDTEKTPGVWDWSDFDALWATLEGTSLAVTLDVAAPINFAAQLDLPADLPFQGFDDPALKQRYQAYLSSAVKLAPGRLSRVTIHTEGVQEYFAEHPGEQGAFCDLLEGAILSLRSEAPQLRVGAYWRYENTSTELRACVQRATDFFALALVLNPPTDAVEDLPRLVDDYLQIAAPKPLALVEVGYPSSAYLGSSEQTQAELVKVLFEAVDQRREGLEMVSYYTVFDESREVMELIADALYGPEPSGPRTSFVEWTTSLGLRTEQGQDKPGWPAFVDAARARRP